MEAKESKFNITEKIREIRSAREELRKAVKRESICCTPMLRDFSLVPKLYRMYCELVGGVSKSDTDARRVFIFVVQYFYAPRSMFGGFMPRGLRRVLVSFLGVKALSVVSKHASETGPRYLAYRGFRENVNRIFEQMTAQMQDEGII